TFYRDIDGDGYGAVAAKLCGAAPPASYSNTSGDCCDYDSNAKPGQTGYFTSPRSLCGGYDYDCANGDQLQYTQTAYCWYACYGVGWYTGTPGCGGGGWWYDGAGGYFQR